MPALVIDNISVRTTFIFQIVSISIKHKTIRDLTRRALVVGAEPKQSHEQAVHMHRSLPITNKCGICAFQADLHSDDPIIFQISIKNAHELSRNENLCDRYHACIVKHGYELAHIKNGEPRSTPTVMRTSRPCPHLAIMGLRCRRYRHHRKKT